MAKVIILLCLNGKKIEWNIQWVYLFITLEPKKFTTMLNIIQLNFVTNKDEIVNIVRDINLGKDDKYKVKSENLQKFCKNQHKIFLEKLNNIMEI